MKTVVITAYAVNPFKGSEDATGWNISREIAKSNRVIMITRKNNIPHLRKYADNSLDPVLLNMEFCGFDLPAPILWLKKRLGERGYVLYFYFWQLFVALFIKRKKFKFDVAHSLNFHSDSHPNFLWMLGKPTFWGPVGHHPKVPKGYLKPHFGCRAFFKDRLYYSVKWTMRNLDPFYRLAVRKTEHIFVINSSVGKVMGARSTKVTVMSAAASETVEPSTEAKKMFQVLTVGRFHYLKGFDVAIRSFARFYHRLPEHEKENVELVVVGKGEEEGRLLDIASQEKIGHRIKWVSWVEREEMDQIYSAASIFLFPSHEGAGMVVAEAMSYGLPIVCFDNVGPGELAGNVAKKVKYSTYNQSVEYFAEHLSELQRNAMQRELLSSLGTIRHRRVLNWKRKGLAICNAYDRALAKDQAKKEVETDAPKTIAVFHPSSELYGADRILINALNALPANVCKRVYLREQGPLVQSISRQVANADVIIKPKMPIIYRGIYSPRGLVKFVANWIRFVGFVRKEHRKYRFKSAYVNTLSAAFILPILYGLKIPNYVHVHEIIDKPKMVGYVTAVLSRRFGGRVVCVSDAVLQNLVRYQKTIIRKSVVLHNGIEPIATAKSRKKKELCFYLFGRIMPQKGQWLLVDALQIIPKPLLINCKFVLMGGTKRGAEHMLEDLQKKIELAELQDCVEIRPFSNNISKALSEADVCLVPSLMRDPFPTTVLEAMSAGKAVIATDRGGAKEVVVDGKTGFLVGTQDAVALADRILCLAMHRQRVRKLGIQAKKRFKSAFTLQHFNTTWREFNESNGFI